MTDPVPPALRAPAETAQDPLRLGYVTYGDCHDPMIHSGVPFSLRRGMQQVHQAEVTEISTRPHRIERLGIKAVSLRPGRQAWERQYLHGRLIARARSRRRDTLARAAGDLEALLHVRTWYTPIGTPYASFIDATVNMVRGYDPSWTLSDRQFQQEVAVEGEFYRRAAVMFSASHAGRDDLVQNYGVAPEDVVIVGAGTTLPGIGELSEDFLAQRFAERTVLFVGKDPVRKGLPELIEGVRLARESVEGLSLRVVGPAEAEVPGDEPWVARHGLVQDKATLSDLYASASMLALPAHRESYGLVIPEALSYGLPCLVSSTGELPHLVEDGSFGAVLPEIAPEQIAQRLVAAFADEAEYAKQSRRALERSRRHDWGTIARGMVAELTARTR
ncbi:glycosyltransferase family 4 protein [Brachybacterium massiliense]|uniref:glycosyltransferase family 4 protein n=1 Tax=Brachybacterium massiliense TaxID=1755098 RepID=UPI000B3BBDEC|nr:glycosyltransferase family 4 protein [Brachybacterium massiliense]